MDCEQPEEEERQEEKSKRLELTSRRHKRVEAMTPGVNEEMRVGR